MGNCLVSNTSCFVETTTFSFSLLRVFLNILRMGTIRMFSWTTGFERSVCPSFLALCHSDERFGWCRSVYVCSSCSSSSQNIPLLLVYLNKSDKDSVLKQTGTMYPNVVTYSQIYNIICQRKFEEQRWELEELENGAQAVVDMGGSESSLDIEDMSLKQKLTYAITVLCEHYSGNKKGKWGVVYRGLVVLLLSFDFLFTVISIIGFSKYHLR